MMTVYLLCCNGNVQTCKSLEKMRKKFLATIDYIGSQK